MNISSKLATIAIVACAMVGCSKVEYDYKALGFASKDEMQAAFDKGYQTKQKLDEMTKPEPVAVAPAPAVIEPNPTASAPLVSVTQPPTQESNGDAAQAAAANCESVKACAEAMLGAARNEALPVVMDAARRIDGMTKPERGDRKVARKLNNEGLEAVKQHNLPDAVAILTKARNTDRADEEIIANLIYAYGEDSNFAKAEQLAYEGLLLNPRRSNIWLSIAIAKQKQGSSSEALQAMWITWQFSSDKEGMLKLLDKRIAEETDSGLKLMYTNAKSWSVDGKKPNI